jgi:hypothetical protein
LEHYRRYAGAVHPLNAARFFVQKSAATSALPRLPLGHGGAEQVERWVFRVVKVLFAGVLSNPQLKPNGGAIQRRDVVATNLGATPLWRRVLEDYGVRQVIFEVKNYEELQPDDFRQVLSYSTREYGRLVVVVTRTTSETPTETEKGWLRTLYFEHDQRVALIVPALVLARCVSKLRSDRKYNYTDDTLQKRMDTFIRSYLNLRHAVRSFRRKHRR